MRTLCLALAVLAVSGCAAMRPPSAEAMASLPILEIGQPTPAGHEYILHLQAGRPAPFTLEVTGDALMAPGSSTTSVAPRQDVYLYKQWASLDGKTWHRSHDLFATSVSLGLDPGGGKVVVGFERKP
jgi:hypothetical protein